MTASSTHKGTVVVPANHGGSSLACIRSLGRHGVRVVGISPSESAAALASKYCDERYMVPDPGTDLQGYTDALLDLAARSDVRTFAPLYEPDIYVLSKYREQFAEHVATPWPEYDQVRRAQDRHELFKLAADAGVPAPDTALLREWTNWTNRTIVKSRYTLLVEDGGVHYPPVRVQEPEDELDTESIVDEMKHEPIAQSFVPSDGEFGFFAVCDEGEPVATFQHRRVRSYTYSGGASVYREAVDIPSLEDAGRRMLSALDWHGPAMVEFRRDRRDGSFKLLEVNPRFWGSLPLAVHAGVDFPSLYYQLAAGTVDGPPPSYQSGVGCHTLSGEVSYLHSVLRNHYDHAERPSVQEALYDIAVSVCQQPNFDYLSLRDGAPFVRNLLNTVDGLRG